MEIKAKIISNSNNEETVSVEIDGFSASVPFGISAGKHEAVSVPVVKALENIEKIIAPKLKEIDIKNQAEVDRLLISLKELGANATLPVSIAALRAGTSLPLWKRISELSKREPKIPKPMILLMEGGKHGQGLDIQEFMIVPKEDSFFNCLEKGKKAFFDLRELLPSVSLGAEGALTPSFKTREALDKIMEVTDDDIALDVASSEFYSNGKYSFEGKDLTKEELQEYYRELVGDYPIISIEDPFSEDDEWLKLDGVLLVGDDLTVTNVKRIKEKKDYCQACIIKPNQIGTVTETIEACKLALSFNWKLIVSHRARETMDDFIADLSVGVGADFIKTGAVTQKERMAKYNRVLAIEKEIC